MLTTRTTWWLPELCTDSTASTAVENGSHTLFYRSGKEVTVLVSVVNCCRLVQNRATNERRRGTKNEKVSEGVSVRCCQCWSLVRLLASRFVGEDLALALRFFGMLSKGRCGSLRRSRLKI